MAAPPEAMAPRPPPEAAEASSPTRASRSGTGERSALPIPMPSMAPPPDMPPMAPAPRLVRSKERQVTATAHPLSISPITSAWETRASVKNTSLKVAPPVISLSGRTSTPGWSMSMTKKVMPWCLGASGSVRARRMPQREYWAPDVQTFWPLTVHSSPSRTALVCRLARSEPAPGSLKSWHQISSPASIGGR